MTINRTITALMAVAVTGLAVLMAVVSAAGRAAGMHQQVLLAALSAAVVLAVHLAPALLRGLRGVVLWPFWSMCLAGALYSHAGFVTLSTTDAAAARLASSPAAAARAAQRADIELQLAGLKARPAGQIGRQLSWTTDPTARAGLQIELREAERADALRAQLAGLSAAAASAADQASADPVAVRLAGVLGITADAVTLAVSVMLAVLLEVLGMLLWWVALSDKVRADKPAHAAAPQSQARMQQILQVNVQSASHQVQPAAHETAHEVVHTTLQIQSDDLNRLRSALERGECSPTITSIRSFMRCGQSKAVELRRALLLQ